MKKLLAMCLLGLLTLYFLELDSYAQQPSRESLNLKKKQQSDLETSLSEKKKKVTDLETELNSLRKEISEQGKSLAELEDDITYEEDEVSFLESPARVILDVTGPTTFLIDFGGKKRFAMLHGISVEASKESGITKVFKKRIVKKLIFVRCADPACNEVYLYTNKSLPSLNAEMVKNGLATPLSDAGYDVAAFLPSNSQPGSSISGNTTYTPSSSSTAGKDVHVRGYYRKDGTYVPPHTRSAPGSKSSGGRSRRP